MAGENTVNIDFVVNDAPATAAFSRLNAEVNNLGGAGMAKAQTAMAGFSQATAIADSTMISFGKSSVKFGSLSADMQAKILGAAESTKPLAEGMRAAGVATKEVGLSAESSGGFMSQFAGRLVGVTAAFEALRMAGEAVKYVVSQSMDLESADVRFKSLAGNTDAATKAFEGMGQVSDDTNTSVVDLSKAATTLLEAGTPMSGVTAELSNMGKEAKIAGVELQEVANIKLRLARGEVGARDLATISRLTGDETGRLQAAYKDINVDIPKAAKAMEVFQRAQERSRQDADRLAVRTTQDANLVATKSIADMDKMITRATGDLDKLTGAQSSFGEAHGGKEIFEAFQHDTTVTSLKGMHGGGQAAIQSVMTQLREGVAQIGKEQGVDAMQLVREGVIGNEEVLAAGSRAREERETKESRGREDTNLEAARGREAADTTAARGREDVSTKMGRENEDLKTNLQLRKEREQQQLLEDARNQVAGTGDTAILDAIQRDTNYQAYLRTTQGQADTLAHKGQKEASHAGDAVRDAYDLDSGLPALWSFLGARRKRLGLSASRRPPLVTPTAPHWSPI